MVAHSGQDPVVKWSIVGHRPSLKLTHARAAGRGMIKRYGDGNHIPKSGPKRLNLPQQMWGGAQIIKLVCYSEKVANH